MEGNIGKGRLKGGENGKEGQVWGRKEKEGKVEVSRGRLERRRYVSRGRMERRRYVSRGRMERGYPWETRYNEAC